MVDDDSLSARILRLVDALCIDADLVAAFIESFSDASREYLELSLSDHDPAMGMMVKGRSVAFTRSVAHWMLQHGVTKEEVACFIESAKQCDHRTVFFKVDVDSAGVVEASWYTQRRRSLKTVLAWLHGQEIQDDDFVFAVTHVLDHSRVHFLARSVPLAAHGHAPMSRVYFVNPAGATHWRRLRRAAMLCGVQPEWEALRPHGPLLSPRETFLSVGWSEGQRFPGMKIDVHGVPRGAIDRIVGSSQRAGASRLNQLLGLNQGTVPDYIGLRLRPGHPASIRVYVH